MKTPRKLNPIAASLCVLAGFISATESQAASATWSPTAANGTWSAAANWSAGGPPNGEDDVATLGNSTTTALVIDANTDLRGLIFSPGASVYSLSLQNGKLDFRGAFDGFGVQNNSSQTQTITVMGGAPGGIGPGLLDLDTIVGNAGSNIHYIAAASEPMSGGGGNIWLGGSSTAGSSTYTIEGSSAAGGIGGELGFFGLALAGNATIHNIGGDHGEEFVFSGGQTFFTEFSSALNASITNSGGAVTGGETIFSDNSTAADSTILNQSAGGSSGAGGKTFFSGSATAGRSSITNRASDEADKFGGGVEFSGNSTAGDAIITTERRTNPDGRIDGTDFVGNSTAGNATIHSFGGRTLVADSSATSFSFNSSSGSATFHTYGASSAVAESGVVSFTGSSSAAGAEFFTYGSESSTAPSLRGGTVRFGGNSTIASDFTTYGGAAENALGGVLEFGGQAQVANTSTFEVLASSFSGAGGGRMMFYGNSIANGSVELRGDLANPVGGGQLSFAENSSAGGAVISVEGDGGGTLFFGSSTAANAEILLKRGFVGGGMATFEDNTTAGDASLTVQGATSSSQGRAFIGFYGSASAGTASIVVNGGVDLAGGGGLVEFSGSATASNAEFVNQGGVTAFASGASIAFGSNSSAGSAHFENRGGAAMDAYGAAIQFGEASTAATGTFANQAGEAAGAGGGELSFFSSASAGTANITNHGSTVADAMAGTTLFGNNATAAGATITNTAGIQGGRLFFSGSSSAGSGAINNNAGTASDVEGGLTEFSGNATAGTVTIVNSGAASSPTATGFTRFSGTSHALGATIFNFGGTGAGAGGGETEFRDSSLARFSTLVAYSGTAGGAGGRITFLDNSRGGTATVRVFGNGSLHIEGHASGTFSLGALEGSGDVYVGDNILDVPLGDYSGVIHNDGEPGAGIPPSLVKTGTGTLILSGQNVYARGTHIKGGTLVAANNSAVGTGDVTIFGGAFLIESGITITNTVILQGGELQRTLGQGQSLASALPPVTSPTGGRQTTAQILGGTASTAAVLESGFSGSLGNFAAANDNLRISDVFSLSGVPGTGQPGQTDTFVLQLEIAGVIGIDSYLAWYDPAQQKWVNAVEGNFGGLAFFAGDRAYNPNTDFVLGNYGVDTSNGKAWAVLNHNSEFSLVPEPASVVLIVAGLGALALRRRTARTARPR